MTSKERAALRAKAHALKPAYRIGKAGITEAVASDIAAGFNRSELLKVKVLDGALLTAREAAEALSEQIEGAQVVQVAGRIVTLYRAAAE